MTHITRNFKASFTAVISKLHLHNYCSAYFVVNDYYTDSMCLLNNNTTHLTVQQFTAKSCNTGSETIQSPINLTSKRIFIYYLHIE